MAKLKRRKSAKLFSTPRKKSRGKAQRTGLINTAIAVMSLLLVAFIFSFSGPKLGKHIQLFEFNNLNFIAQCK